MIRIKPKFYKEIKRWQRKKLPLSIQLMSEIPYKKYHYSSVSTYYNTTEYMAFSFYKNISSIL